MRSDASRIEPAAIAPFARVSTQIKNRQRVRDRAEVYTHEREVNAMLGLVPDMFPGDTLRGVERKFLEPACGSGNFLEEILRRKLRPIRFVKIRDVQRYEHWLLRALASIYAVDICAENVGESQERLLALLRGHYNFDAKTVEPTAGFLSAARVIVTTNVLRGDTLTDASTMEVVDYKATEDGAFMRTWSMLDDSATAVAPRDLFTPEPEVKQDEVPVRYSELARHLGPVRTTVRSLNVSRGA